jgi:WS/DGAT/MGAT family acyltransferase
MQQLSGVDTMFLNLETGAQFGHVSSICIYEPGTISYESVLANLEERLHLIPPFRRKLVEVPLGLDHPYWIEDEDFDLEFHVRHTAIPAPGTDQQLATLVERLISKPLDRSHPLWELWVIEGLSGGRVAQLTKIHHATIDGAAGVELLGVLLDIAPEGRDIPPGTLPPGEPAPSAVELLGRTAISWARRPRRGVRVFVDATRGLARATRNPLLAAMVSDPVLRLLPGQPRRRPDPEDLPPRLMGRAPKTSFNGVVTARRGFAFASLSLPEVKEVKSAFGATVNDVVMELCSGSLRRYLDKRGELPDEPLMAMIPVSLRTGLEEDPYSNRVSALVAPLATHLDNPLERLQEISRSMTASKGIHDALPAETLVQIAEFAPPALAHRAMRVMNRLRVADRTNPPFNVTISNVPGPRIPLYQSGSKLQHFIPVSTVGDGSGLNITVQSYLDTVDVGVVTCRDLVPDPWEITQGMADELQELLELARSA